MPSNKPDWAKRQVIYTDEDVLWHGGGDEQVAAARAKGVVDDQPLLTVTRLELTAGQPQHLIFRSIDEAQALGAYLMKVAAQAGKV